MAASSIRPGSPRPVPRPPSSSRLAGVRRRRPSRGRPNSLPPGASWRWPSTIAGGARVAGSSTLRTVPRWDDRLRFSQHASTVRIRRKRLLPETQLIDIRNAITFLQGEPGVDPARIGVWGTGVSGAHVVALAATDARVKAGVAVTPGTVGQGSDRLSFSPTVPQRTDLVRLARSGQVPATQVLARAMNADETRLALAEYRPLALLDQIPKTSAVLQITDQQGDAALEAAVQWFLQQLQVSPGD